MLFIRISKVNTRAFHQTMASNRRNYTSQAYHIVEMNRLVSRQLLTAAKMVTAPRQFSVLAHNRKSPTPLIEHYRSAWPDVLKDKPSAEMPELPKRTVPDDLLRFNFTAHFDAGGAFFYPHLKTNPADFKVRLKVNTRTYVTVLTVECVTTVATIFI